VAPDIEHTSEFDKCMKHLRKYKTIYEDLETFKQALIAYFPDLKPWRFDVKIIPGFGEEYLPVYKARHFHCNYLNSSEKIRLIYTFNPTENKIIFIEIYFKGDRENHNPNLIKQHLIRKSTESN
jgi:hypothetical protein